LSELTEPSILVAADLSALDFARLPTRFITGLLTTEGGATSHVAIIARALGFPAVVGARTSVEQLRSANTIALDGSNGFAIINPDAAVQASFQRRVAESVEIRRSLEDYIHVEPMTKDGVRIEVSANIGSAAEAEVALQSGAMGIGLFRTEFMFMRGAALPTEQEQFRIYSRVLSIFAPKPVLIRTLDVGGDKPLPGVNCEPEANPFLGWRGIRMCLDQPELFHPQLRALLRASCHGKLRIMFPMISDVSEVIAARAALLACRGALEADGIETGPIEVGIMIETPAAALCALELAKHVDFFSIGTNDLTQYTMAADRTNARLERLSRVDHPAVLQMIELACNGALAAGIWVGVCGEAAGDPAMIPRLLSWGVTELSMSPSLIPRAKKLVTDYQAAPAPLMSPEIRAFAV
jgi:phosphocarrier protein FPr